MIILDANYILRFLLRDDNEMYHIAKETIQGNECWIDYEVMAEVVFVLQKVYKASKGEIRTSLENFISLPNISLNNKTIIINALRIFEDKNLDFVDAILCAKSKEHTIKTFDKKLNKCIEGLG